MTLRDARCNPPPASNFPGDDGNKSLFVFDEPRG